MADEDYKIQKPEYGRDASEISRPLPGPTGANDATEHAAEPTETQPLLRAHIPEIASGRIINRLV